MSTWKRLLRRARRRLFRPPIRHRLHAVYHERYTHAFPNIPNDPLRGERILAFLAAEHLIARRAVHTPKPISLACLGRVHSERYLNKVHDPKVLTSIMGYTVEPDQVDRLLDFQRLQSGGTLLAVRLAREHGLAINLGGGFHHALSAEGGGFCLFNDIAAAIAEERQRGFRRPILVIDLDLHDGNGTREVFADDPSVHTFSIHGRHWEPVLEEAVESTAIELGTDVDDATYLDAIRQHLPAICERFEPRLVIYVAGCDPAREDALGEWRISPAGMLARDRLVAEMARHRLPRIPLAIVLAGGYSEEAWRYTARFLSDLVLHRGPIEPPSTEEMTYERYSHLSSVLDPSELSGGHSDDPFGITAEDVYLPGWGAQRETRFLGFYTRHGLELVLEQSGLFERLRDLGYSHPTLELQLEDPGGQTVRVMSEPAGGDVLGELRARRDRRTVPGMEVLFIDWLLLQNPRAESKRSLLPGQSYPGLGMLGDIAALLVRICERLHLDGVAFVPSHYHIAAMNREHLVFLKPEARARFAAFDAALEGLPFAKATRAVADGRVIDTSTDEPARWQPEPMVLPVSEQLVRSLAEAEEIEGPRFRRLT